MIPKLALVLVVLVLALGTERMAQSLVTILTNCLLFLAIIAGIYFGCPPSLTASLGCFAIFLNSLFYSGGVNEKTISAFYSVLIVMGITAALSWVFIWYGNLQGFMVRQYVNISAAEGYTDHIRVNMLWLTIAVVLITMLGTAIDTSVTIASAMYEVRRHSPDLSEADLRRSGISVGKDIVSSSMHTLFFIFFAEYMTLFIYFAEFSQFSEAVNSKEVVQQIVIIAVAGLASALVIPVTSSISAHRFARLRPEDFIEANVTDK